MSSVNTQFLDRKTFLGRCVRCNIIVRKARGQIRKIKTARDAVKCAKVLNKVVSVGDRLCDKCGLYIRRKSHDFQQFFSTEESVVGVPSVAGTSSETPFSPTRSSPITTSSLYSSSSDQAESSVVVETACSPQPSTSGVSSSAADVIDLFLSPEPVSAGIVLQSSVNSGASSTETSLREETSTSSMQSSIPSDSLTQDPSFVMDLSRVEEISTECVEMPFARVISTHKYFFVCGSIRNIINVPAETRKQVFLFRRIYVPKGNRCCRSYLQ